MARGGVIVECGEQSQFESKENRRSKGQMGASQRHQGLRSAGHVMSETMFPRVKLERKTSPKKFVASNGEQIKDLGKKNIPFKTIEGIQRCITFRSANVVKPLISMQKVVRAGNSVVLDEKNPHIRNIRDGTVIKLDVSNGVYTMDMWVCLDETGALMKQVQFSIGRDSEWSSRFRQACKAGSIVQM